MGLSYQGVKNRRNRIRAVIRAAREVPCYDCNIRYPWYVMQFHHRDPKSKKFIIGRGVNQCMSVVLAEIEKCDVLCANCHCIRTHLQELELEKD